MLLLTHSGDHDVPERVARALKARGAPSVRVDTDAYPGDVLLSLTHDGGARASLDTGALDVDLLRVRALWCRRLWPARAQRLQQPWAGWAAEQAGEGLWGTLAVLALHVPVVNPPHAQLRAEHKPLQLHLAHAAGLRVPPTVITNDPAVAEAFCAQHGQVVTKLLAPLSEDMEGDGPTVSTHVVDLDDRDALHDLKSAPQIFQRQINKTRDVRAVVCGARVLAAGLTRQPDDPVDWRRDPSTIKRWRPVRLPPRERAALGRLVKGLGLVFAVVDLAVDDTGRWWFLELNPAGEWGFLERHARLPVAATLARVLAP